MSHNGWCWTFSQKLTLRRRTYLQIRPNNVKFELSEQNAGVQREEEQQNIR